MTTTKSITGRNIVIVATILSLLDTLSASTTTMFPKSPALGSLRLANISDIPRIAVVATAGFYYSPVFGWERPFHKDFPQDTFHSYEAMFAKIIEDPEYIALVAEDLYDVHESSKTKAIIKPDKSYSLPKAGSPVIVGAATWKLEPGSPRKGQFNRSDNVSPTSTPSYDGGQGRDKSLSHAKLLDDKCEAAENKYFTGHQLFDMLVVHPAYWKRGHGTKLVNWGKELTSLDRVKQGVIAADMGEKLYLSKGYQKLDVITATDEDDNEQQIEVGVLEFAPRNLRPEL